jgi:hypothetical protein
VHAGAQIDQALGLFDERGKQIRGEGVDGKDVLETIDRFDSAFAITDAGVVNHRVERTQTVRLVGERAGLLDARQVPDHDAAGLGRRGLRVSGAALVAGVEDDLVTAGKQSLRGHEAETVRRSGDQYPAHG